MCTPVCVQIFFIHRQTQPWASSGLSKGRKLGRRERKRRESSLNYTFLKVRFLRKYAQVEGAKIAKIL